MSDPTTEGSANAPSSPSDRATTFQAVQGPQPEHYSGEVLLVSAYAILWSILLVWVATMWRKQRAMSTRVDELEKILDRAADVRETDGSLRSATSK
jgi:hypothetical protein